MWHDTAAGAGHRQDQPNSTKTPGARSRYIKYQLVLSHDPFLHNVAETELKLQSQHFHLYFVNPEGAALEQLSRPQHCIVFAPPGCGKTTLRVKLTHQLRLQEPDVLPLTYEVNPITKIDATEMQQHLVRELGKDLLISVLRLYGEVTSPPVIERSSPAADILATLAHNSTYRRQLKRLQLIPFNQSLHQLWENVGRSGTPDIAWNSPAVAACVDSILALPPTKSSISMQQVIDALHTFGLSHLYLLVDGVDAIERPDAEVLQLLRQFLDWGHQYSSWLILKLFLPAELEIPLQTLLAPVASLLPVQQMHLRWSDADLERAFYQRLKTSHGYFEAATDLFDPLDAQYISHELLRTARGSPRELFRLVSEMIDAHVRRKVHATTLSVEDWRAAEATTITS